MELLPQGEMDYEHAKVNELQWIRTSEEVKIFKEDMSSKTR
jgi:hypothetical protein